MFCKGITHYRPGLWHVLSVLVLTCVLVSCASKKDDEKTEERKPADGEIRINLIADKDINPNDSDHPAPLNIFIYSVKERDVFTSADFFDIVEGKNKSIQTAASKVYEAILLPGEKRTIYIKPDSDVRALGFIGAYRDLDDAVWMNTWDIPDEKKAWWQLFNDESPEINARFQKTTITIKKWIKP